MADSIFRRCTVPVNNSRSVNVEFKPITDIFRFNQPPYIIVGSSTSGKTTLCLDILAKYSSICTSIYYVTSTEDNLKDDGISMIPRAYRRRPNFETLYGIWREIKAIAAANNVNTTKALTVLSSLIGKTEATNINHRLEQQQMKIQNDRLAFYRGAGFAENEAIEASRDDGKAFYIDTITRLICDFAKTNGTRNLSADDMATLSSFFSATPRIMLLLDDVSAELDSLRQNKKRVNYEGNTLTVAEAYKALLIDMLSRGRHHNAIICMFLHSIELMTEKSYINNIVVLNAAAAQKLCNARTFPNEMRDALAATKDVVFNGNYPYHFIYLSSLNTENVLVGKAELQSKSELPLSKMNELFVKACNDICSNISIERNSLDQDDEYEYEYEEVDDVSGMVSSIV